ncbi:hypothetical protein Lser_V15G36431 [Lactuca serriola]
MAGKCVIEEINNYTTHVLDFGKQTSQYNLIKALLFLSYFMGDIPQVWDDSITETAEEIFYDSDVENLVKAI